MQVHMCTANLLQILCNHKIQKNEKVNYNIDHRPAHGSMELRQDKRVAG